jgi:alpha-L-rhamnosidase
LISSIAETDNHPGFGILGAKYVLNVLTDSGRADLAYKMVTQTTYPSWGHWIEQGATTLWETWEGKASLNHIMFGDVSSWMFKTLAGIAPDYDHPGFQHFECRPHVLGDVTWVKAEHKTLYGRIKSDWKIGADSLEYHVEIPVNTAARVFLPARDQESVSESGRPVTEADGVAVVGMEDGCLVMEVGSGEYDFEVAFKAS